METGLVPMICHPWGAAGRGDWGQVLGGRGVAQAPGVAAKEGAGDRPSSWIRSLCAEPCTTRQKETPAEGDLFLTSV